LVFAERQRLVVLLFKNRDVDEVSEEDLQADRLEAINLLIALGRQRVPLDRPRRKAVEDMDDWVKMPDKCGPLQCLDCFYDDSLPYSARIFAYATQASFRRHVKSEHFSQYEQDELRNCPAREIILESEMHFKNHALREHGVKY
jgi:hypothetical protein